jgi:hypothetical protein
MTVALKKQAQPTETKHNTLLLSVDYIEYFIL